MPDIVVQITTVPQSFKFLVGLVGYLKARGFEVHCLSSPGKDMEEFAKSERVPVHAVEMTRRITPLRDLLAVFRLWQKLCRIRPHIVHARTPKGGLLGMIGAWLARVLIRIYHIHGLPLMTATGYERILLRWSEKVACLLAHQVLCVSHSVREVAIAEGLCLASKIKVLLNGSSNGIDAMSRFNPYHLGESTRQETRSKYNIPGNALVVGFVGRIVRDKGVAELTNAWKILRETFPTLHLLIVGPFEPQDPVPSDVKKLLHKDPRIHLTGYVDDMPPLYAAMDVLAFPSYREGFPTVGIEASAMKLPVVATHIPGCVDAVRDGVTGTLVPLRDAEALAEAIRMYLNDPDLRHRHGQAGRERVLRDFRQEEIWEALYQEYVRLLLEKGLWCKHCQTSNQT